MDALAALSKPAATRARDWALSRHRRKFEQRRKAKQLYAAARLTKAKATCRARICKQQLAEATKVNAVQEAERAAAQSTARQRAEVEDAALSKVERTRAHGLRLIAQVEKKLTDAVGRLDHVSMGERTIAEAEVARLKQHLKHAKFHVSQRDIHTRVRQQQHVSHKKELEEAMNKGLSQAKAASEALGQAQQAVGDSSQELKAAAEGAALHKAAAYRATLEETLARLSHEAAMEAHAECKQALERSAHSQATLRLLAEADASRASAAEDLNTAAAAAAKAKRQVGDWLGKRLDHQTGNKRNVWEHSTATVARLRAELAAHEADFAAAVAAAHEAKQVAEKRAALCAELDGTIGGRRMSLEEVKQWLTTLLTTANTRDERRGGEMEIGIRLDTEGEVVDGEVFEELQSLVDQAKREDVDVDVKEVLAVLDVSNANADDGVKVWALARSHIAAAQHKSKTASADVRLSRVTRDRAVRAARSTRRKSTNLRLRFEKGEESLQASQNETAAAETLLARRMTFRVSGSKGPEDLILSQHLEVRKSHMRTSEKKSAQQRLKVMYSAAQTAAAEARTMADDRGHAHDVCLAKRKKCIERVQHKARLIKKFVLDNDVVMTQKEVKGFLTDLLMDKEEAREERQQQQRRHQARQQARGFGLGGGGDDGVMDGLIATKLSPVQKGRAAAARGTAQTLLDKLFLLSSTSSSSTSNTGSGRNGTLSMNEVLTLVGSDGQFDADWIDELGQEEGEGEGVSSSSLRSWKKKKSRDQQRGGAAAAASRLRRAPQNEVEGEIKEDMLCAAAEAEAALDEANAFLAMDDQIERKTATFGGEWFYVEPDDYANTIRGPHGTLCMRALVRQGKLDEFFLVRKGQAPNEWVPLDQHAADLGLKSITVRPTFEDENVLIPEGEKTEEEGEDKVKEEEGTSPPPSTTIARRPEGGRSLQRSNTWRDYDEHQHNVSPPRLLDRHIHRQSRDVFYQI